MSLTTKSNFEDFLAFEQVERLIAQFVLQPLAESVHLTPGQRRLDESVVPGD